MAQPIGDSEMFRWDGGCVFIGSVTGIVPVHAHQAIQVCHGIGGPIRLRGSDAEAWHDYPVGIVASRQPHEFDATFVTLGFVMFVEPETREGRALTERCASNGFGSVNHAVAARELAELFNQFMTRGGDDAITACARGVLRALTNGIEPPKVSDDRILRAISWINAHLDRSLTLDEVAAQACLSPSRFRHLFIEQTGVGFRPYVLWRRLTRIWELTMRGKSISYAAHAAGFADAAHLTRTSKRMIGLSPSMFRVSRAPGALSRKHAPEAEP